ncbi:integrin alpha-PS1-like isoform X3 [Pollicipes pollicipes]|uniref:integrin alpha-PS1-like isoform X3 n=1 Tax=Pollicipes pollicipes TaxID=41117 RepID=UPI0018852C21|nr:integrin alpha-PS1-like isoform X3 [Pollicipes pollicipes]
MAAGRYLLALVLCSAGGVIGFNLEPRIPIIKNGAQESFFGFSVALHQSLEQRTDGRTDRKSWLLVGAPLGKNLQPQTERSGALWKCPLTTLSSDCVQVATDGRRDPVTERYRADDPTLYPPSNKELKEGQWMGVTVRSQGPGRKVLVCAHRYVERGEANDYHWGHGLCYTLKQDLDFSEAWSPCFNLDTSRAHEQYGYCQAGTSGLLTDDDNAVIGLPGPYTWRGTVFAVNISDAYLLRDKVQYFGPVTERTSPVDKYSYLGMAVAYGRFFPRRNSDSMVGGAPRSKGTGQVVFFSRERIGQKTLRYDLILDGEMFASQFGYELCAIDFNNDGMTDLVVGAPFHFTDTTGGAIYIYKTPRTGLTKETERIRITGAPESRFGFALSNLGDLNKDGFSDLAVGAPFEGHGVVYIYLGGHEGLSTEPAQVIRSENVVGARAPITFGYSLGGGTDIDGNGYPDLLVGSFCNDTVALIRARPIVGIVTKVQGLAQLESIDPSTTGCAARPGSEEKCVPFQACFKMESLEQLKTTVDLEYRLEAETFQPGRHYSRVRFLDGLPQRKHIVEKTLPLSATNTRQFICQEEVMFVNKQTLDIQTPIPIKLTYSLKQRKPRQAYPGASLPDIDNFPILNQQEASKVFLAKFTKNCGNDEICQSELLVQPEFDLRKDDEGFAVLVLGPSQELRVNATVINHGEPAYDARMFIGHPPHISFIAKEPRDNNVVCNTHDSKTVVCYLGNPVERGRSDMVLRFDVSQVDDDDDQIELRFSTNTTSEQVNQQGEVDIRARVAKRSEVSVSGRAQPEQSFYGGEVRGEAAIQYLDEIGSPVMHKYEVYNAGPSTVEYVDVHIEWPAQVQSGGDQGKWLLYMTKPPVVQGDGECFLDKVHVNPLNLKQRQEEPSFAPASVFGAYVGGYQSSSSSSSSTSISGGRGSSGSQGGSSSSSSQSSSSSSSSQGGSSSISTSYNRSSTSSSSFSTSSGGSSGGDHHDRVVVEDTTVRKTDLSGGLNAVDSRRRKPDDAYRRRRPLDRDRQQGRGSTYESSSSSSSSSFGAGDGSRRTYARVDGDREDDYGQGIRGGGYTSSERRTYQTSQSAGGSGAASVDRRGYGTGQSSGGAAGGGRYSSSSDELERRYGAGQGFRTSTLDVGGGGGSDSGRGGFAGSRGGGDGGGGRGGGGGRYDSSSGSNDELERRYGAGQGFRTSTLDVGEGGGSDGGRGGFTGSRGGGGGGGGGFYAAGGGRQSEYGDDQYDSEYDGPTGRPRRPGGRRRGYYRRRRPFGGAAGAGGNQSYSFQRRYESRRPYPGITDRPTDDLEARRDELSGRRVAGGTEHVERTDGGTRRTYQAHRPLNGGYEREELTEEERRLRREQARRTRRDAGRRRVRREQEMVVMPEAVRSPSGEVHQVIFMDCERNSAKCIKFRCRIHNLPEKRNALVYVQGRIWNSTLVEDYADASWVSIKSRATLEMDPSIEKLQDISDDVFAAETLAYPDLPREAEGGGVPIWVIIVSVLAGLLLLALVVLILWKLGFFKRRRPDPTLKSNISR